MSPEKICHDSLCVMDYAFCNMNITQDKNGRKKSLYGFLTLKCFLLYFISVWTYIIGILQNLSLLNPVTANMLQKSYFFFDICYVRYCWGKVFMFLWKNERYRYQNTAKGCYKTILNILVRCFLYLPITLCSYKFIN